MQENDVTFKRLWISYQEICLSVEENAGEFYTPPTIVKLLVILLAAKAGETA